MGQLLLLLLFFPLVSAIITACVGRAAKTVAFISSLVSLGVALWLVMNFVPDSSLQFGVNYAWIQSLGIGFKAGIDGLSIIPVLLTNLLVPIIILTTFNREHKNESAFVALMLFMQSGLLLVFTAMDAFLFYIGWEAALIPIYFICAIWGGNDRIRVNMKFFVYTVGGSLFMLLGILYLYLQNPAQNFDLQAFYNLDLDATQQSWIFWAFFLAFAIKMPVFPFHTWQPDTYTEAPAAGTMLLSGIMLKMGIYGVIRWILPVVPLGLSEWGMTAFILSIIGIVYASIIAFKQQNAKRLIAYSSIAHVGLISAGIFALNAQSLQGAMIQMLSHGINVVGLFFIMDIIVNRMKTSTIAELGGIAKVAPKLAVVFLIILLGTVALPGTNGFVGEFLLLMGVYQVNIWAAVFAGLTIIFGAVYMFRTFQGIMLGKTNDLTLTFRDIQGSEQVVLYVICALVIIIGVYPKPLLHLSEAAVQQLLEQVNHKLISVK